MADPLADVVKVAVPVPLSRVFDYLPAKQITDYLPGARVLVPFAGRMVVGMVVGCGEATVDVGKLKPVAELLDPQPQVSAEIINLVQWSARYYHYPLGEAWATALPAAMRKVKFKIPQEPVLYRVTDIGQGDCRSLLARAPSQLKLLAFLLESPSPRSMVECRLFDPAWSAPMKQLVAKELVETVSAACLIAQIPPGERRMRWRLTLSRPVPQLLSKTTWVIITRNCSMA